MSQTVTEALTRAVVGMAFRPWVSQRTIRQAAEVVRAAEAMCTCHVDRESCPTRQEVRA